MELVENLGNETSWAIAVDFLWKERVQSTLTKGGGLTL